MQFFHKEINFENIQPFDHLEYNLDYVRDSDTCNLKRFIITFDNCRKYDHINDFDERAQAIMEDYRKYHFLIDEAIKTNNLKSLETLWKGLNNNGIDPNYKHDVYCAAEFGTIKTFLHVLYAFMHYPIYESSGYVKFNKLIEKANLNTDTKVKLFVNQFHSIMINKEKISAMSLDVAEMIAEDFDLTDIENKRDKDLHDDCLSYCKFVNKFVIEEIYEYEIKKLNDKIEELQNIIDFMPPSKGGIKY